MEELQDCNSKSLVALPGSLVLHLCRLFGQQDQSWWQKYILAYFLLVRNDYFSGESKKHSDVFCDISELDFFPYATDLDSEELKDLFRRLNREVIQVVTDQMIATSQAFIMTCLKTAFLA